MAAGLAGGNWQTIAKIIDDELSNHGLQVTVYDLK
jgi:menaquinone-dependent protoporphyrinogen IX oxidase